MRISNPQRFANRVVIPSGVTLFALALYINFTKTVLLYGVPITLIAVTAPAFASIWLAVVAYRLKENANGNHPR